MRVVRAVAWMVLVVVGSVAAAGLSVSVAHRPTDDARPELTARDAAILAPRLAAIEMPLEALSTSGQALAASGRDVLVGLRALDVPAVDAALDAGGAALGGLNVATAEVRARSEDLLRGLGTGERLPVVDRDRVSAIRSALVAVDGLTRAWADIGDVAVVPVGLLLALRAHDEAVAEADALRRAQHHARALVVMGDASDALGDAFVVRDAAVRAGRDVHELDHLLSRLADHDADLRVLYRELVAAAGARTPRVEEAMAAEEVSRVALPQTTDALSGAVIGLGVGDITAALLAIDDARGAIEAALGPVRSPGAA